MSLKRDKSGSLAALVSFRANSDKFDSNYERNKFYRGLYGWEQVVKKRGKKYTYDHKGLLDKVPHIKVDKSVYIFPLKTLDRVTDYLDEWGNKVEYKTFRTLLDEDRFKKMENQTKEETNWVDVPVR